MKEEIDPERSKKLISQGYEDAMTQLADYNPEAAGNSHMEPEEGSGIKQMCMRDKPARPSLMKCLYLPSAGSSCTIGREPSGKIIAGGYSAIACDEQLKV